MESSWRVNSDGCHHRKSIVRGHCDYTGARNHEQTRSRRGGLNVENSSREKVENAFTRSFTGIATGGTVPGCISV